MPPLQRLDRGYGHECRGIVQCGPRLLPAHEGGRAWQGGKPRAASPSRAGLRHRKRVPCNNLSGKHHCKKTHRRCRELAAHVLSACAKLHRLPSVQVVFVSSIAGTRSAGTQVAYACSKGAVLPLARSLAAAWGKDK